MTGKGEGEQSWAAKVALLGRGKKGGSKRNLIPAYEI